jgi:prolyl oligopeptidase
MKQLAYLSLAIAAIICPYSSNAQHTSPPLETMNYPETKKTEVTDTYFGTNVSDPYRWLEDDQAANTKEWVKAQNLVTQNYFAKIPFRNAIKSKLEKLWNYEI